MRCTSLIPVLLLSLIFLSACVREKSLNYEESQLNISGVKGKMGKKALFIIAPENFRDEELLKPKKILESEGIEVEIASTKVGKATGMLGTEIEVKECVYDLDPSQYDAVILVGGIGAQVFFTDEKVQEFLRAAYEEGKIVGAICISPVTLAIAGLLKGKNATVWHTEAEVIEKYGAKYTGSDVEVDGRIVTASGPAAAEKFGETIAKALRSS